MTNLKPAPHDIALIDFEASSLDECISYPIQVGVSFADTAEDIDTLIRPHIDPNAPKDKNRSWVDWNINAEIIHKIRRERLFEKGVPEVRAVAEMLAEKLGGMEVYSDSSYDAFWNARLFEAAGIDCPYEIRSLKELAERFDFHDMVEATQKMKENPKPHDALSDARTLRAFYTELHKRDVVGRVGGSVDSPKTHRE